MKLSSLLRPLLETCPPESDPLITGVCADSRRVKPGDLFIAIRGYSTDGHKYIGEAIQRGAVAVVLEDRAFVDHAVGAAAVCVPNSRRAAAVIADEFYGHPSRALTLVGVTGTNGKTTVSLMLESIFAGAGHRTGVVGTLGRSIANVWRGGDRTTPDAIELQALLAEMRDAGVTHVSMEVSSHALELDRVHSCQFAGAVFTNLSQDHLDFHADLEEYLAAKLRLFTTCADLAAPNRPMIAAVNMDDPAGHRVKEAARCPVITYGTNGGAQVRGRAINVTSEGVSFELVVEDERRPVHLRLTGHFNVHNALGAAACCWGLGFSLDQIVAGLEALEAVPGRFEKVTRDEGYTVIVDYAHTPGALENVLQAARALNPRRLICVMGCGGDRDRGKRPMMGKVATQMADLTIITSDNPRSEDPEAIIQDILGGVVNDHYIVEPDRREAIFRAVGMCEPGDMVIIAGKGHETYQEFAHGRVEFDDRVVVREAIAARAR